MRKALLSAVIAALMAPFAAPADDLPPLPSSLITGGSHHLRKPQGDSEAAESAIAPESSSLTGSAPSFGPRDVARGTIVRDIALGEINRILTPFDSPSVTTVSDAETKVKGRAVYVAPKSMEPVSLFISEEGSEEQSVSLVLFPKITGPRDIRLGSASVAEPERRERSEAEGRGDAVRSLVLTALSGKGTGRENPRKSGCRAEGLAFRPLWSQRSGGYRLQAELVKSASERVILFSPRSCPGFEAVGVFPSGRLKKGSSFMVFTVRKEAAGEP
ncbi:MAG: hypothetical protein SPL25_03845 [Succinivibrionaceae bacterium]|nr:hypothetical protein [Succinivibrionaceae bacterium]